MEEQEQKLSKYNSGVAIQIRLDGLWRDANNHSRSGAYSKWNEDLDTIWSELARDIPGKEFNDKQKKFSEFDKKLTGISPNFHDSEDLIMGFKKPSNEIILKRAKIYLKLREKELFLKRLENHLGKGTAFDDEDEDGF